MKLLIPPIKVDAKLMIRTYLYFFILASGIAYVWLLAMESPFDLVWPLKSIFLWNLEVFFIPVLILPLMLTLIIHRSFWYGIVAALIGSLIALAIANVQETGWLIFGIVVLTIQIIIAVAISSLGLLARRFFRIRSKPARSIWLVVPIVIVFLMGSAFYVSPTYEGCARILQSESLIKETGKHNQCFRSLAIKMLDPRICTNIISDTARTEVGWCMKDVFTRQQKQGTLSPSACDVITIDSRNVKACKSALAEIVSS